MIVWCLRHAKVEHRQVFFYQYQTSFSNHNIVLKKYPSKKYLVIKREISVEDHHLNQHPTKANINNNDCSIEQSFFPFKKFLITVDRKTQKIHFIKNDMFSIVEEQFDLKNLDENPARIKRKPYFLIMSAVSSTIFFILAVLNLFYFHKESDPGPSLLALCFFGFLTLGCWHKLFKQTFDVKVYYNRYTGAPLLTLSTNNPNKLEFEQFVEYLQESIIEAAIQHDFSLAINRASTSFLVDDILALLINELINRGVDISSYLLFLQKKLSNTLKTVEPSETN